jgi:signal transduction histidine kinase
MSAGSLAQELRARPILIVDDQPAAVELLRDMLEDRGHTSIHTTTRSAEVMDLCARIDPDLVLLDVQMPRPSGLEVLAAIRSSPPPLAHVPVLVLTSDVAGETRLQALAAGASDFLLKPIGLTEAALRITNLLALRTLQRQLEAEKASLEARVVERTERLQATVAQLTAVDAERRRLLISLVKAQEEERRRIASDVHDDPLQIMAATRLRLGMLRAQLASVSPEVATNIEALERTVTDAIDRLRQLVFELHPRALQEAGLVLALEDYLRTTLAEALRWKLDSRLQVEPPDEVKVILFRIAQEALSNIRKHANASEVTISLDEQDGGVLLRVRDDGRGFTAGDRASGPMGHFGLQSMRERAEAAGGRWGIQTAVGEGTAVEAWLPTARALGAP